MLILKTKRLLFEEVVVADAPFFLELLNTPTWIEHIGDRGVRTIEAAEEYLKDKVIKSYIENGFGFYKLLLQDEKVPIGICGVVKRPDLEHPDIGYALLPKYTGKGYALEAAKATMEYATSTLQLDTIVAITTEANEKSRSLLEKIGLQLVGKKDYKGEELLLYRNN